MYRKAWMAGTEAGHDSDGESKGTIGMLALSLRILDRLEEVLIASLMAAATLITFVAVVHRYLSTVGWMQDTVILLDFGWAQELAVYMFIWVAKFGAAYGVRTGIHVGVDVLINRLSPRVRGTVITFGLLCGALFTGVIGTLGTNFVWNIAHTDQVSAEMEVPVWIVYLAIPCGSYLMCFRFLQVTWHYIRNGTLPSHSHAHVEGIDPNATAVLEGAPER
jgi:C4-dicarboxylate transporter DctQ subunit